MRNKLALVILFALSGASLFAAPAVIQKADGANLTAVAIDSDSVSGIAWQRERGRPGTRVKLWEIGALRYTGQGMDEFNGMPRRMAAGNGARLIQDADIYLRGDVMSGFNAQQWKSVLLSCMYFRAQGFRLQQRYRDAVEAFEKYLKEADENLFATGAYPGVNFDSPFSGRVINGAGGLHRYYLDALEALGDCYLHLDEPDAASTRALQPLQRLSQELSSRSGDREYYDWAVRAVRASAEFSEAKSDYDAARRSYEQLHNMVLLHRDGGRASRESIEAQLKVGFMNIRSGNLDDARRLFLRAPGDWTSEHEQQAENMRPPADGWLNEDRAYLTAGSYVGEGLILAAEARNATDWTRALRHFSMALAVFHSADDLRSMALLGAAQAAARLAELSASRMETAAGYAQVADSYLGELTLRYPESRSARDPSIAGLRETIARFKRG